MDPVSNQGHRVTCKDTVALVHEVLSHQINPEIVATINGLGELPKGFPVGNIHLPEKTGSGPRW